MRTYLYCGDGFPDFYDKRSEAPHERTIDISDCPYSLQIGDYLMMDDFLSRDYCVSYQPEKFEELLDEYMPVKVVERRLGRTESGSYYLYIICSFDEEL